MLAKQLARLDEDIGDHVADLKDFVRTTINGRIKEIDAKYILVRGIVLGACGIVLIAFMGAVVAWFVGAPVRPIPTLPQPYTIQPRTP